MLDIDGFKRYNDMHGHAQGDEAVKQVGRALRKHARKPFVACRYGGDEFCVILPGTGRGVGRRRGRASARAVQASMSGEHIVTISVGYACQTGNRLRSLPTQLFEAADAALYSAKERAAIAFLRSRRRRRGEPPRA